MEVDFLFITALEEERDALLARLTGHRRVPAAAGDTRVYYSANIQSIDPNGNILKYASILMPIGGMGRTKAAAATSDAIQKWRPRAVVLCGIAGGIAERGLRIGDVLVADQIVDYELQKVTQDNTEVRWSVHRADERLLNEVRNLPSATWQNAAICIPPNPGHQPKRHIANVATGDKVVAVDNFLTKHRDSWPTISGVEMEAGGVAESCFTADPKPAFLMIRAISDLADEHKDDKNVRAWRAYAADLAAAFTMALVGAAPLPPLRAPQPAAG